MIYRIETTDDIFFVEQEATLLEIKQSLNGDGKFIMFNGLILQKQSIISIQTQEFYHDYKELQEKFNKEPKKEDVNSTTCCDFGPAYDAFMKNWDKYFTNGLKK